jgi:predicted lactoylglutathione lyase
MVTQVFINLPIQSTEKSNPFFEQLGFTFNSMFSNELATCLVINEYASVMLLEHVHFKNFTKKEIANAHQTTEVLLAITKNSKEEVDEFIIKALSLGALEARETQNEGFMYSRAISDLDGHIWEIGWMDMNAFLNLQNNQQT